MDSAIVNTARAPSAHQDQIDVSTLSLVATLTHSAVAITDREGHIEWANESFARMAGYRLDEVIGLKPGDLLQTTRTDPVAVEHMRHGLEAGESFRVELLNRNRAGREFWVALELQAITNESGEVTRFISIASDITAQRLTDLTIQLQYGVARILADTGRYDERLIRVLDILCTSLDYQLGAIWLAHEPDPQLHCDAVWHAPRASLLQLAEAMSAHASLPEDKDCAGSRLPLNQPLCEPLPAFSTCQLVNQARAAGLIYRVVVPVAVADRQLGILEFWQERISPPAGAVLLALQAIGQQLAQFVARQRDQIRLQKLTRELSAIFTLSPDGFVACNERDEWTYANPAFHRITGLERKDGASRNDLEAGLRSLCHQAANYASLATLLPEGNDELELAIPELCVVQRSVRTMQHSDGSNAGFVLYLRDVTREREVERMKSEFLSTAAHELRTPMASIFGFSQLLLVRKYDEARQRELLERIHRQSGLLSQMVNELLDLARIEARAGTDFAWSEVSLADVVRTTVDNFLPDGNARPTLVDYPSQPIRVRVDEEKFSRALTNVIANAHKYSPDGGEVRINFIAQQDDGQRPLVGIEVRDQGIGMTPEQLSRICERFYRANPAGPIPGTGLGMSLVKEIMGLLGGSLALASTPGQGTTVTLWLEALSD
ncbi:PAS domain S-box protein [Parachitinimonas caeni]|uniref:histidine kinase n=1 Tax=Parachitinimonas caeni TaxID=3031301 RepID=A0ABT7DSN1_9NEIS|nr:PAS domain S-box protein [Parachitinimonas caeni]MDK2122784.1 PAS domain-containing protein [Parachitinimonas caeni]